MSQCEKCGTTICEHGRCPNCEPCKVCYQRQHEEMRKEKEKHG